MPSELQLGVAMLPRRCAITEIANGRLVAVPVAGVSRRRQVMIVCRKEHRSHAADAFLAELRAGNLERAGAEPNAPTDNTGKVDGMD